MTLPYYVHSGVKRPGPASKTLYYVQPCNRMLDPDLDYPSNFQSELAVVHYDLYFLKPNALALSAIEQRPVLDYFDRRKYEQACQLYQGPGGPLKDLDGCCPHRHRSWYGTYRALGLVQ